MVDIHVFAKTANSADMNRGPLSVMIVLGTPNLANTAFNSLIIALEVVTVRRRATNTCCSIASLP